MLRQTLQRLGFVFRKLTRRQLDVLDQLEEEHIRVEMLFLQWRLSRNEGQRKRLFDQIRQALSAHMHREETLFYPACAKIRDLKDQVNEGFAEHRQVKTLLKELASLTQTSERANAKMRALVRAVEHHVSEEENELFPKVRMTMKKGQFNQLSRKIRVSRRAKVQKLAA